MTPGCAHLYRIAGPPHAQIRRSSQISELFDRLMRRSILSLANTIVGIDMYGPYSHQGRHPDRISGVLHEHQEGPGERDESTVQGEPAGDGRHGKLPNAVIDVIAAIARTRHGSRRCPNRAVRTGKVCRAADQFGQLFTQLRDEVAR